MYISDFEFYELLGHDWRTRLAPRVREVFDTIPNLVSSRQLDELTLLDLYKQIDGIEYYIAPERGEYDDSYPGLNQIFPFSQLRKEVFLSFLLPKL